MVVCNPPYVPLEAWESVAPEARDHDPHLALFSGADGLDAIRVLAVRAAELLRPGGVLGVEHADVQGESVPAVLTATGRWTEMRDHRDLQVVRGSPPPDWHDDGRDAAVSSGTRPTPRRSARPRSRPPAWPSSAGGLVVLPTDTVYGLAADAFDKDSVPELLDAKGRGRDMPPPVLVSAPPPSTRWRCGCPTRPGPWSRSSGPAR